MKRWSLIALFGMVLLAPLVIPWHLGREVKVRAADLELFVITPHQEAIRREFAEAFSRYHQLHFGQSVNIDYRTYGTGDISKYFRERARTTYLQTHDFGVDVVWGGGDSFFDAELKRPGYLEQLDLGQGVLQQIYPQPLLGGLPLYDLADDGPMWFGTALSGFGIVYNRDVVRHLGLPKPKTWADLADGRYAGWIALADPTRSYSARAAYMAIIERAMADAAERGESEDLGWAEGMGQIRQIAANARLFTDSASVVPIMVSQGDAAAGMAIDFYGRSQAAAVGLERMGYVEPVNATVINPDPIALVKGAPNRQLAEQFIRFVLSPEGQMLWAARPGTPRGPASSALWRQPVRQDVYADMSDFVMPMNPFVAASRFNKSSARQGTWRIFGELIQMSCIDLLDELVQTRQAILRSPRARELDARLARFPFDQREALERQEQWRKATPARRLELQRNWTETFREEYRRLRELAK